MNLLKWLRREKKQEVVVPFIPAPTLKAHFTRAQWLARKKRRLRNKIAKQSRKVNR